MDYIITNKTGQLISSSINSKELITEIINCKTECERVFCEKKKIFRRQGVLSSENYNYYLLSYDQDITNRIFKFYYQAFKILSIQFEQTLQTLRTKENQKTRRLKHNLITHSSNILLELYKLFPQDSFRNGCNHLTTIENIIRNDIKKTAYSYLKILKSSNLMKAEFDVYEMLETESPYLDFSKHSIHKVLILTLNPFWLDLIEQNVNINIDSNHSTVTIDYKSISVVLSHIFDNMTKYIMPYSTLHISFSESEKYISIIMDMNSLKVNPSELNEIFRENFSGDWAKKLDLDGDGIGMFIVKELTELNNGIVKFEINTDNTTAVVLNGVPYEKNRIIIQLNK